MQFENSLEFAKEADKDDPLALYRKEFFIPVLNGKEVIYLSGNSLGLQPHTAQEAVLDSMEDWASFGVAGYTMGNNPWIHFRKKFPPLLSKLVGASNQEIAVINQLTANLHLMMATFYRPEGKRKKVICEGRAFPADVFAVRSQMELRGVNPDENLIFVLPKPGELTVRNEDIIRTIRETGEELALVLIGGVNYYTGQVFFMKSITSAAHEAGAYCGFDLAHAVGNVELKLHDWEVDFAVWCSYKYLNAGPGSVGGLFIHEKHVTNAGLPRLQGLWGTKEGSQFQITNKFVPNESATGWQWSLPPVMSMASLLVSLEIFESAGFDKILAKTEKLTSFLLFILNEISGRTEEPAFEIVTPLVGTERGAQVSLKMGIKGRHQFDVLRNNGVIAAWRKPNILRIAPVPLYNSFQDVFYFGKIFEHAIHF